MPDPMTPPVPADAVARLTKLADDYASRGDFATEDDIRTLLAAYADAARDRERLDALAPLLEGADFAYGEYENRRVILLHLPDGVRVGADLRDFADAVAARTLLAAYADAARDRERVEWLEAQAKPHHGVILCAQVVSGETPWASVQRVDHRHNPHKVEWCHESHDIRAAIDAARTGEAR